MTGTSYSLHKGELAVNPLTKTTAELPLINHSHRKNLIDTKYVTSHAAGENSIRISIDTHSEAPQRQTSPSRVYKLDKLHSQNSPVRT